MIKHTTPPDPVAEQYLRVPDVAALLRVSPETVWRYVWTGALRSVRVGRLRRVPASAVGEFLAAGGAAPPASAE
jgi:excisionase family DNA binding protein